MQIFLSNFNNPNCGQIDILISNFKNQLIFLFIFGLKFHAPGSPMAFRIVSTNNSCFHFYLSNLKQ